VLDYEEKIKKVLFVVGMKPEATVSEYFQSKDFTYVLCDSETDFEKHRDRWDFCFVLFSPSAKENFDTCVKIAQITENVPVKVCIVEKKYMADERIRALSQYYKIVFSDDWCAPVRVLLSIEEVGLIAVSYEDVVRMLQGGSIFELIQESDRDIQKLNNRVVEQIKNCREKNNITVNSSFLLVEQSAEVGLEEIEYCADNVLSAGNEEDEIVWNVLFNEKEPDAVKASIVYGIFA